MHVLTHAIAGPLTFIIRVSSFQERFSETRLMSCILYFIFLSYLAHDLAFETVETKNAQAKLFEYINVSKTYGNLDFLTSKD